MQQFPPSVQLELRDKQRTINRLLDENRKLLTAGDQLAFRLGEVAAGAPSPTLAAALEGWREATK